MAKRKYAEEHENLDRWLVSYADFITLLFAFFVVMYSVSKVDTKKLVDTASAVKWALHFKGTGGVSEMPIFETVSGGEAGLGAIQGIVRPELRQQLDRIKLHIEQRLSPYLSQYRAQKIVQLEITGRSLVVRLAASHFFDPSFAALRPEALPVLDAVASELADLHRPIRVEGHTDNTPIHSSSFRDNWELSSVRAARIVAYLQDAHGIDPTLLSAAGYAATKPVASNDTPEGREQNRRLELVVEVSPGGSLIEMP
jgi:chemotaxis protein MotB